jgi:hypothetical protein
VSTDNAGGVRGRSQLPAGARPPTLTQTGDLLVPARVPDCAPVLPLLRLSLPVLLVPVLTAACGGQTDHGAANVSGPDAGEPDTAAPPATGLPAFISIGDTQSATTGSSPSQTGFLVAVFDEEPAVPYPAGCSAPLSYGPCVVDANPCPGAAPTGVPAMASAGALTASGLIFSTPLLFAPSDGYSVEIDGNIFAPGSPIAISADGATVPSFTSPVVVGPGQVALSVPATTMQNGMPVYQIPAGQDLAVAWEGGLAGARVSISLDGTGSGGTAIGCTFDAAAGSGTIPAAALATLGPAGSATAVNVAVAQSVTTTFGAGAWSVELNAASILVTPGVYQ